MDPSKFSKAITPLCSTILDLPPSCIEFVPGFPEFLVVGTYNLRKEVDTGSQPQSRTGSLNLFKIVGDELTLLQTLSHPSAILDLHFLPNGSSKFGIVSSTGTISIYSFQSTNHEISLLSAHQAFDPALLILSFAWYPAKTTPPILATTLSDGTLHLLQFTPNFNRLDHLNDSNSLNSHTLEAWTCSFALSETGPVRIYSGGDDGKLRLVELESIPMMADEELRIVQTVPANVFKGYDAGVTAILPMPISNGSDGLGDIVLTGSYDDHVRVYETKQRGKVLAELKIGGGVWRLKFFDSYPTPTAKTDGTAAMSFQVLASCMHAGARVLEVTRDAEGVWNIRVLGSVTVHESMNYGTDVQPIESSTESSQNTERLCVSTSFYDRLVCVWKFDSKAI